MNITYEQAIKHIKDLGFAGKVASNVVLVQEALSRGLDVGKTPSGRGFKIDYAGRSYWWRGGNNSLNTRLAKRVTQYKSATNALLGAQNINTTRPFIFTESEVELAWNWAQQQGSVVIKPDDSQGGSDVFLDVQNKEEFFSRFSFIAEKYDGKVLVEPFFTGDQVRFLLVNGEVVAATLMRPASVVGDGRSTIEKLIKIKNKPRLQHESHEPIKLGERELKFLADQGLNPLTKPAEGQRVFLSRLSNLQQGGDSVDVTDTVTAEQIDEAKRVNRAIPGLRIAGVDMIVNIQDMPYQSVVLEVNCSPQLSIHHFPWEGESRNVAANVIDAFFPSTSR